MQFNAKVDQINDVFIRCSNPHICTAKPGIATTLKIRKTINQEASKNVFSSAAEITEHVLSQKITQEPTISLPAPKQLAQNANRKRKCLHPEEPQDLEFAVAENLIPDDFLQNDVQVDEQQHIIFAKPDMISILSEAKNWYIDATFKVIHKPFTQLFSIHVFVKSGESAKQIPL